MPTRAFIVAVLLASCADIETTNDSETDADADIDADGDIDVDTDADGDVGTDADIDGDDDGDLDHDEGGSGFAYRRRIPITAGSGAGAGYQVRLRVGESAGAGEHDVHLDGRGQRDFRDLRFTDDDGQTLLDYWVESVTGTSPNGLATVWVEVADDLDADQAIYVYSGNPEVADASNGEATFAFYDGFEYEFGATGDALDGAVTVQDTPTYDGSGQTVHPDVVFFDEGWRGYRYWMATTPYPGGNDQYENPSVLASDDGASWEVPAGLANPLIGAPPCDHNCDADLIYNPETDELWLYYLDTRRSRRCGGHEATPYYNHDLLQLFRSADGVTWTGPTTVIDWDLDTDPLWLSPSIVVVEGVFSLWVTNGSDRVVRYESDDGIHWGARTEVAIEDQVWHLNVDYIAEVSEYWMLTVHASGGGILHWATSRDGVAWTTYPGQPVRSPDPAGWDANLYRGCVVFHPDDDLLEVWYSAYRTGPTVWRTGWTSSPYSDFIATLEGSLRSWPVYSVGGSWSSSREVVRRGAFSGQLAQLSATPGEKMIVYHVVPLTAGFVLEWDLYDDLDDSAMKLVRINSGALGSQVGLGVWTGSSTTHYAYHDPTYTYTVTSVERSRGWHGLGIRVAADGALSFSIDDRLVATLPPQFTAAQTVSVEGFYGGPSVFQVDDVRVRRAAAREPTLDEPGPAETGRWDLR